MKTKTCRTYNAPSAARLNAFTMQVGVGAVVQFVTELLTKQKQATQEWTTKIQTGLDNLFPELAKLQCNVRYIEETCSKVANVLLAIWPPDEDTDAVHMLSVTGSLTIELREDLKEFWREHPDWNTSSQWLDIEDNLDKIFELFNADLSENYAYAERVPEVVEKLQATIWPTPETRKELPLRLYLVNDTYWVAATSKSHAKELVQQRYACAITKAENIQPTEIFEDGSNAADLVARASGTPGIIAMTQEIMKQDI